MTAVLETPQQRRCVECLEPFTPSSPKSSRQKTCSKECALERRRATARKYQAAHYEKRSPHPPRACEGEGCTQTFVPYTKNHRFCTACRREINNTRPERKQKTRTCRKCGFEGLPVQAGVPVCDDCRVDPRKHRTEHERRRRLRRYGITQEKFDQAWAEQGERCAICHSTEPQSSKGFAIDHDHSTGAFRGILCHPCNTALGLFRENQRHLAAAADYLDRHSAAALERPLAPQLTLVAS